MLSLDITIAAAERVLRAWQDTLAEASLSVELHRDILKTPAEQLQAIEASAAKALVAIKAIEAKLAGLRSPAHRIAAIVEQIAALEQELAQLRADAPPATGDTIRLA